MIEIIPNWHPIFVHFTVALFSSSFILYVLAYWTAHTKWKSKIFASEFETVARWCLWVAALMTIATVSAGFYAYYTVKHDTISHAVMTVHRNWALATAAAIFLMASWAVWRYVKHKGLTLSFIIALLIVQGLLLTTAWYGGELVYRYGIGVMSLPQAEEIGHHHEPTLKNQTNSSKKPMSNANDHDKNKHPH